MLVILGEKRGRLRAPLSGHLSGDDSQVAGAPSFDPQASARLRGCERARSGRPVWPHAQVAQVAGVAAWATIHR
jgi:hypothetical protein